MIALRLALLSMFLALPVLSGCTGGVVPTMLRTTASLATITSSGYRMLRAYDATKQEAIRAKAALDAAAAQIEKNTYLPKQQIGLKVLDAASVGVEAAYAAVPVVGQALDAKKRAELAAWITTLLKLGADVTEALTVLGIKLPALGGAK